jgi:transcriptional regulator with XRE-family HTH domain
MKMINRETKYHTEVFAEEAFVVDVQSFLQQLMIEKGFNRVQLAEAMGVSRARISQIFSDDCKNLTIRLLARVVHALGDQPEISSAFCHQMEINAQRASLDEAISAAPNVCRLWQDVSNTDDEELVARTHAFASPDPRISATLGSWARRVAVG